MNRLAIALALAALVPAGPLAAAPARKVAPAKPAAFARLHIGPAGLLLEGPRSRQQIVVTGIRKDGSMVDLTAAAKYGVKDPKVALAEAGGLLRPRANGSTAVTVSAGGLTASAPLTVRGADQPFAWNFQNHVEPVLSKTGCNMGACHGAAAGKNGFRLTLRGYDPDLDYERLMHESGGRRIMRSDPGNSLLLKKATMAIPHAGGVRFKPESLEYKVISEWIATGTQGPSKDDAVLERLEIFPNARVLAKDQSQQFVVRAHFKGGRIEDVTHWAKYSSNDEGIATVGEDGKVTTTGVGETAVAVGYLSQVAFATVTVPFPNKVTPAQYTAIPRQNKIDDLVLAKLKQLKVLPSPLSSDEEFVRRVYLDVIGTLPKIAETRAFLADSDPQKRAKLIDSLLERPEYVDFWTYKWADLLRVNRETLTEKGMWSFYSWLREQVASNRPWNELVHEVLTSTGSTFSNGPANFYRTSNTPEDLTETVSQAFLGIRVGCAKCHNHPFEKWTQADYYSFANLMSRVSKKKGEHPSDLIISVANTGEINFPKTGKPLPPAPYDYAPVPANYGDDRRAYLADWLTDGKNEYFSRSIVNRIWRHYMGRGLIEPVDDLRATNPASNEPLMSYLTGELVRSKFDLKGLMRQMLNSRTYQLTSRPLPENKKDDRLYSRYLVRRLTAEQLLDAISEVTGVPEQFSGLPAETRAIGLPDTKVNNYFLDVFGRPPRQITCDCERAQEPNMAQALHLINGAGVNAKIASDNGTVARLLKSDKTDPQIIEEMYLLALSRPPTSAELKAAQAAVAEAAVPPPVEVKPEPKPAEAAPKAADAKATEAKPADMKPAEKKPEPPKWDAAVARRQVFEDILWALINGKEFVFNH